MKKGFDYTGIVVCNFCHNAKGEYVLGFRSDKCRDEHFTWEPTGSGSLKFGEKVEDAVRREVAEELATDVLGIEFLGIHEAMREIDGQPTHWLYLLHKVLVDEVKVSITEPEKCLKLAWFSIEQFPAPLMSQFPPLLERYKNYL
jgi:ADP-ribose pyrophosphatase YjhB (NUDIX family)